MIWMSHPDGSCMHLNQMLRSFWAVDEAAVGRFDWRSMMHPEDADAIVATMRDALTEQRPVSLKGRYRSAAGDWRVLETEGRPRFSASGAFLGMIGVNVDVTERERADAQRELLLVELNHRAKNMLAVVQAIAHHTFGDAEPQRARAAFQGRLAALAQAHDLLIRSNWESASLDQIARDTLLADDSVGRRITLSGPRLLLPPKQALAIAMALHELFTNAVKYGALSVDVGSVELRWSTEAADDPRLTLVWREHDGPPVVPRQRKGFGSLLLERSLAMDLDGAVSLEFRPEGLVCAIEASLPAGTRSPADVRGQAAPTPIH
jgi:PAS domain S-box-containing protein